MIAHDSWWSNGSARSTIIDYHEPFDQGLKSCHNAHVPRVAKRYTFQKLVFDEDGIRPDRGRSHFIINVSCLLDLGLL